MNSSWAVVTGGSSGIGFEMAKLLILRGTNVILIASRKDILFAARDDLRKLAVGVKVEALVSDLSQLSELEIAFQSSLKLSNNSLSVWINNAGFGGFGEFQDSSWEKELKMINLNITALTFFTKKFVQHCKNSKEHGYILNVASVAAFLPGPLMAVYYATKAYVLSFGESIAYELKNSNISVTTLCPGATESNFQKAASMDNSKLFKGRKIPTSKEVAEYGLDAMFKGTPIAIHGAVNWFLTNLIRFIPRSIVPVLVKKFQEPI